MSWMKEQRDYGVLGITNNGHEVRVYHAMSNFQTINLGNEVAMSAYWAGENVVVMLQSGKTRCYMGPQQYVQHG